MIALMVLFGTVYLASAEFIKILPPRSDVLLFQRGHIPATVRSEAEDEENSAVSHVIADKVKVGKQTTIPDSLHTNDGAHFVWSGLTYKIKEGKKEKTILSDIDGWVKPGTLTALMVCIHASNQLEFCSQSPPSGRFRCRKDLSSQCASRENNRRSRHWR